MGELLGTLVGLVAGLAIVASVYVLIWQAEERRYRAEYQARAEAGEALFRARIAEAQREYPEAARLIDGGDHG